MLKVDRKALLTSFQLHFMAFSALLIMLVASLSSCCEENLDIWVDIYRL